MLESPRIFGKGFMTKGDERSLSHLTLSLPQLTHSLLDEE